MITIGEINLIRKARFITLLFFGTILREVLENSAKNAMTGSANETTDNSIIPAGDRGDLPEKSIQIKTVEKIVML